MKSVELIKSLSKTERKQLIESPEIQRRETVVKAVKYLYKCVDSDKEFEKEAAVKAVLKTKFSKKDWNHLRQLLHIINQVCEEILIEAGYKQMQTNSTNLRNYLYLSTLLERKQFNFFDKEYDRLVSDPLPFGPFDPMIPAYNLQCLRFIRAQSNPMEKVEHNFIANWYSPMKKAAELKFARIMADLDYFRAYCEHALQAQQSAEFLKKSVEGFTPTTTIDVTPYNDDPYIQYRQLMRDSNLAGADKEMEYLEKMEQLLQTPEFSHKLFKMEYYNVLNSIAIFHSRLKDFDRADEHLVKLIATPESKLHTTGVYESNRISLQWARKTYRLGTELYKKDLPELQLGSSLPHVRTFTAACHMMLDEIEECKELVFENTRISGFKQVNDRLMLAICFFNEGNYELMNRELENVQQLLKTKEYSDRETLKISTRLLNNYTKVMQQPKSDKRDKKLEKLREEVAALMEQYQNEITYAIIPFWLAKALEVE